MKACLKALPAFAALVIVATALPPQEYGSLTPALQATIGQELPPYSMDWEKTRADALPGSMAMPASGDPATRTQTSQMPDPETVPH
jgi:hypothetical protein